jgi:hypothetical protein
MGYVASIGLKALVISNQEIYDEVLSSDPFALANSETKVTMSLPGLINISLHSGGISFALISSTYLL